MNSESGGRSMNGYAHSLPNRLRQEWQKLNDHLKAVAQAASETAGLFHSGDWAWNAGWLHDLGKATNVTTKQGCHEM